MEPQLGPQATLYFPTRICSSVFITGCNRGLGLAFVKYLLNLAVAPNHIFATCRSLKAESARELKELSEKHSNLHLMEFDVRDVTSHQLPEIVEKVGALLADSGLNLLINNAGIIVRENLDDVTAESMKRCYEVNTIAPLMITKAFRPLLKRATAAKEPSSKPQATIINISSTYASINNITSPNKLYIPYSSSKVALNMVTKSLSVELANDGILAVAIHPGWLQTDMGGKDAPVTVEESVSSIMKLFGLLDKSKSGCYFNYDGSTIPW